MTRGVGSTRDGRCPGHTVLEHRFNDSVKALCTFTGLLYYCTFSGVYCMFTAPLPSVHCSAVRSLAPGDRVGTFTLDLCRTVAIRRHPGILSLPARLATLRSDLCGGEQAHAEKR